MNWKEFRDECQKEVKTRKLPGLRLSPVPLAVEVIMEMMYKRIQKLEKQVKDLKKKK